jgi:hypothetical protein
MCSGCEDAKSWLPDWLRMRGVPVRVHDVSTAEGLAWAAWLELADLEVVPVLALVDDERGELVRYIGSVPAPEVLEAKLREMGVAHEAL